MAKLLAMLADLIHRSYPDLTDDDYAALTRTWSQMTDTNQAREFYEAEVLPRSAYRVRRDAPGESVQLLFVPVGTQPYAPIMACLGNPSKAVLLLYTEGSASSANEVVEAFAPDPGGRNFHKVRIDENDPADIARKVQSSYDVLGQPAGEEVICDITGGTKVMVATLAGIAAVNGWRQSYVNSKFLKHLQGSHSEQVVPVHSVFEQLGGWHRAMARGLAAEGQFGPAFRHLHQASEEALASAPDRRHLRRFELARAYREADLDKVAELAERVADESGRPLPTATLELLASKSGEGFLFWVCSCLLEEGQTLAARGALGQLLSNTAPGDLHAYLPQLEAEHREKWRLADWKPIDDLVGAGYSKEVARRG